MTHINVDRPGAVAAIMDAIDEALAEGNVKRAREQIAYLRRELDEVLVFGRAALPAEISALRRRANSV